MASVNSTIKVKHAVDPFKELGFTQSSSWLWIYREYNLVIENYGDFTGTFFQIGKQYYLSYIDNVATLVDGQEIAAGSIADIVAAVKRLNAESKPGLISSTNNGE